MTISPSDDGDRVSVAEQLATADAPAEFALFRRARRRHPICAWWWGRRTYGGVGVAWCYVCDAVMTRWTGRMPPPDDVTAAIHSHRDDHLREVAAESTPTTET